MSDFFTKIQNALTGQAAQHLRLAPEEKQRMRVALYEAMQRAPRAVRPPAARPAQSPYVFVSFLRARVLVPLAAVLVVALGSGTAYAAQGSLPGSPLYAVKRDINDQVRLALAQGAQAQAQANAAIAQERLEEAQALEAQGTLDATTTAELQENFDEHAAAALALIASSTPAAAGTSTPQEEPAEATTSQNQASTTPAAAPALAAETSPQAATSSPTAGEFHGRPALFAARISSGTATTGASSTAPAFAAATGTPPAPQHENGGEGSLASFIARQRQQFDEIRERVEAHAHGNFATSSEATSTGATSSGGFPHRGGFSAAHNGGDN